MMRLTWQSFAPVVLFSVGCQIIVGVDSRTTDPLKNECTLPAPGPGQVRFTNLVPNADRVDICLRPAGGSYGRPVYREWAYACPGPAGLGYEDVSIPFGSPIGKVDAKAVPAGLTCAAPAVAETLGVDVGPTVVVTLALVGDPTKGRQLLHLPESVPDTTRNTRARFVHAIVGQGPVVGGEAIDANLPTQLAVTVTGLIPFGATTAPNPALSLLPIDSAGYASIPNSGYNFGLAPAGSPAAIIDATLPSDSTRATIYGIGNKNDLNYPVRGLVCSDTITSGLKAKCSESQLAVISLDTWDVELYGDAQPGFEDARRPLIQQAIKERTSDVMCVLEVPRKSDRDAIIALATQYPYNAAATTDQNTPLNNPATVTGQIPPAPTAAACAPSVIAPNLADAGYQCLNTQCATVPGDPTSKFTGGVDCLTTKCSASAAPLLATRASEGCLACVVETMIVGGLTFEQSRNICTTQITPYLGFNGDSPVLMLSKFPLTNVDQYVLPGTGLRRTVLYAQVQIEPQKSVDLYCTTVVADLPLPYTGNYANGDDTNGWLNEALLDSQRTITWVKQKSGTRSAIITGDWWSSVAEKSATTSVGDLNPVLINGLRAAFTEARPKGFLPTCTRCPANINAYNVDTDNYWDTRTYLYNMNPASTTEASVLFNKANVPLPDTTTGMMSGKFGFNVQLIRP